MMLTSVLKIIIISLVYENNNFKNHYEKYGALYLPSVLGGGGPISGRGGGADWGCDIPGAGTGAGNEGAWVIMIRGGGWS